MKLKTISLLIAGICLGNLASQAETTTIRFNYGWDWSHNYAWQTDFDTAEVDVQVDRNLLYYSSGWNDLDGAVWSYYGRGYVDLVSINGAEVTLESFDMGNWYGYGYPTQYQVYDLANPSVPVIDEQNVVVTYDAYSHPTYNIDVTSSVGVRLVVGPDLYNIGFTNIVFSTVSDSDGDGVPDNVDLCPNSILTPTVIVGGTDTGITNTVDVDGCSIADIIQIASDNSKNHGAFVSAVAKLANDLKSSGAISGKQAGKLKSAAAKAK